MFDLRGYQRDALDAQYGYWGKGGGNSLIVLPTGSGKSLVMAALCQDVLRDYPLMRIAIATHVKELIAQDHAELVALWPEAPVGIYSAGLRRRDTSSQILVCGIQSVHNKVEQIGAFDLLLIDEAHLIPRTSSTMYQKFIITLMQKTPDLRIVGLTATPYRLDSGRLDQGEDRLFETVVYEAKVRTLIDEHYLCPLITKATLQKMDVLGVGMRGGDFIPNQLEIAVDQDWITRGAVDEIMQYADGRRAWLVFCAGVDHATHVRDEIRARGVSCETVIGDMPKRERDALIASFRLGQIRCLVSVMVLGTGFNVPGVDLLCLLRPTASPGLFMQQVGRGLRKAEGKANCLVLDFAGNTRRHGPIDLIDGIRKRTKKDEDTNVVQAKECPQCKALVALAAKICPTCSYVWEEEAPVPSHGAVADADNDILADFEPQWVSVTGIAYARHEKIGKPPSLRVDYFCGLLRHSRWVCFEHDGYARDKARQWWIRNAYTPPPATVDEALRRQGELTMPREIRVKRQGKYFEVIDTRLKEFQYAE
jgi:DNA repair protein RadD